MPTNMNDEHREDFKDPKRGTDAMEGIARMLRTTTVGGRPIELGTHVLEIGAAFGATTVLLRQDVERLTGVEVDPDMAAHAAARVAGTNAEVTHADASDLPFEDDTFTSAICIYVLHHVSSTGMQDRVLSETARVLRPGGVLFGWDSLDGREIREYHFGDVFVPVDADTFETRLLDAGFAQTSLAVDEPGTLTFAACLDGPP